MDEVVMIVGSSGSADVYMSDGAPAVLVEDMDLPLRDRVELFVTGYDCEWQNPREIADTIIAMVRDSDTHAKHGDAKQGPASGE